SFTIHNTGTPNCSNESTDITNINSSFPYTVDTEPDVLYVNAPGLSCQLVYDQTSGKFKPVEYQDLVITYGTASDHTINSFTIINDAGTKYIFNVPESALEYIIGSTTPLYFSNTYNQYKNFISYNDKWFLSSITDVDGNSIALTYTTAPSRGSQDSVQLYIGGSTTASLQYIVGQSVSPKILSTVVLAEDEDQNIPNETLTFTWNNSLYSKTGQSFI